MKQKYTETIRKKFLIIYFPVRGSEKTITSSSGSELVRSSGLQPLTGYLRRTIRIQLS